MGNLLKTSFKNLIFCCAILMFSCQDSSVIDVPREYEMPANFTLNEQQISFSVEVNGAAEPLEIIKNQFQCEVFKSNATPYFVIKTELQNPLNTNANRLNSVYFRANSLPADGKFYSLSGDPANALLKNAAKIVYVSNSEFEEIVPQNTSGNADNFQVRIVKKENIFQGEILCNSVLNSGLPVAIRATFEVDPAK